MKECDTVQIEPQITFHGLESDPQARERILDRLAHLETLHGRITSCRVRIEAPHRSGQAGTIYRVVVDVTVPHGEVVVGNTHELNHAHEDLLVAIRDSFDAVERRIDQLRQRMDPRRTKTHPPVEHGTIARLMAQDGYGFIETADGREFYFSRDSMTAGSWTALKLGDRMRFVARDGDKGPFATSVKPA